MITNHVCFALCPRLRFEQLLKTITEAALPAELKKMKEVGPVALFQPIDRLSRCMLTSCQLSVLC